ncbi:hypothetical protein HK104_010581 [Borealophlyctis nickersoniae]|nr:hypothetical protein HK104_010581 [Borealophlyctis nickersoniae]
MTGENSPLLPPHTTYVSIPPLPAPESESSSSSPNLNKSRDLDRKIDKEIVYEFGGPCGVTFMMIFFPLLMYYLWISLEFFDGALARPDGISDVGPWLRRMVNLVVEHAAPNMFSVVLYVSFCLLEAVLAVTMPGPTVKGLPVPSLGGKQLEYKCNGVWSFYVTIIISVVLHAGGVFNLASIIDNLGPLMTVSIIAGFAITFATYFWGVSTNNTHRMSGNPLYDLFMGAVLNPRIGSLDLKMWSEIRVPWVILFYISVAAAVKSYQTEGYVSPNVWFMVLAHFLYVNACMKGEECIPTTWDIFYEKWGFMLIFWNMVRLERDTANSQKNRFRMSMAGTYIPRHTFPQLPWGTLHNPTYIRTKHGSLLLTSGWWGVARKIHYTADLMMALSWGLICGFGSVIPYFYVTFFVFVLVHRVSRDMERCAKKYGDDWVEYCRKVPYIFIPGIY